jgi:hypothetical protein
LGVYTGKRLKSLKKVASNDNSGDSDASMVRFKAVRGRTYAIAVDGYGGAEGNILLSLGKVNTKKTNAPQTASYDKTAAALAAVMKDFGTPNKSSRDRDAKRTLLTDAAMDSLFTSPSGE